jgi:hypothetical protein
LESLPQLRPSPPQRVEVISQVQYPWFTIMLAQYRAFDGNNYTLTQALFEDNAR